MEQVTFLNALFLLLGLLLNAAAWLKKEKKDGKEVRLDISVAIQALTGIVASCIGLGYARDLFETGGAVIPPDHVIYTAHAFVCGLMPNIILTKVMKAASIFIK